MPVRAVTQGMLRPVAVASSWRVAPSFCRSRSQDVMFGVPDGDAVLGQQPPHSAAADVEGACGVVDAVLPGDVERVQRLAEALEAAGSQGSGQPGVRGRGACTTAGGEGVPLGPP
ncbi:hypothetical protein [Streptomyces sp. NBC_01506]|uniref:hypothetical protein n=1 Tax=Streptomyces sp. NBC_01506 TaxID=2903887 RepID=UPI00386C4072